MREAGVVYLVGAGPGDPDLLTVKAARLLASAQAVVYDRLVSEAILDLVPQGVTRISVAKAPGHHSVPQPEINRLLARLAGTRRRVVRLKGGDPFVFGRGSEEAEYLQARGIRFEVVPGITAALACTAYAGVPLTHRGLGREVRLVTGHFRHDRPLDYDWRNLAATRGSLVFYMGLGQIEAICSGLVGGGMRASTPAAAVQDGTSLQQRTVIGDLGSLAGRVAAAGLRSPVLIVVGETVALAGRLNWFEPTLGEDPARASA